MDACRGALVKRLPRKLDRVGRRVWVVFEVVFVELDDGEPEHVGELGAAVKELRVDLADDASIPAVHRGRPVLQRRGRRCHVLIGNTHALGSTWGVCVRKLG